MIKTFAEFECKREECSAALAAKFSGTNGMRAVVLCGGTGCLSSDSAAIREKIEKLVIEKGLSDKVTVTQTGCIGICQYEPVVEIIEDGKEKVTYVKLTPEKAAEIVEKHLKGGKVIKEYTITNFEAN